jgi:cytochrome b561
LQSQPTSRFIAVYNPFFRGLHWLMAILIFCALGLGVWMIQLPRGPGRAEFTFIHKSFGVAVLALIVIRIVARLALGKPPYAFALGPVVHWASEAAHLVLYALMLAMPISGYITSSAGGHEVPFFGLFALPNIIGDNKTLAEQASGAHYVFAWAIGVVLAAHLLAVVWHAWIRRDSVLTRMWPRFQS